ncbi:hypothetical protein R1flu_008885 [Riccia fluitans]|uniref:Uncharacterized protein n=1 Tax=Riccia fluitans TaxID=41844 RepID=A0ABD1Z1B6_9MARC
MCRGGSNRRMTGTYRHFSFQPFLWSKLERSAWQLCDHEFHVRNARLFRFGVGEQTEHMNLKGVVPDRSGDRGH